MSADLCPGCGAHERQAHEAACPTRNAEVGRGLLDEVAEEMMRQDANHPTGYPPTRDGVRLGIAAAEDELAETKDAWRRGRGRGPDWSDVRMEAIQTVAVLLRMVQQMPGPNNEPVMSATPGQHADTDRVDWEGVAEDLRASLHRIANLHGCPGCIYDAFDDCRVIAKKALNGYHNATRNDGTMEP